MKRYHNTPTCKCGGPMVGRALADWNHRAKREHTIVCCACGEGRVGTAEENEQARRADEAWNLGDESEVAP